MRETESPSLVPWGTYKGRERAVLFFGSSTRVERGANCYFNKHNLTPYDFWEAMKDTTLSEDCLLVPLMGTGSAHYTMNSKEVVVSIIDSYFHYYHEIRKSMIISIPTIRYEDDRINLKQLKKYIELKKKIYDLA